MEVAENTMSLRNNEFLGRTVPRGGFLGDLQANPQYPSPKPGSENEVSELRTDRNDLLTKNAAPDLSLSLDVPQKKFLHGQRSTATFFFRINLGNAPFGGFPAAIER
jgi:hypothetical protein